MHDINPGTYLIDVLQRVETHTASRVDELTPRNWKTHFADNPLRSDVYEKNGADRQEVVNHLFDVGEIIVLDAGKGVSGYGVSRPFGHGKVIGPIVARDETDAVDLFHALLSPGIIRVDRPADAVRFNEALEGAGLFGQEVCDEMELGCWPTVDPGRQGFAMASHAWG
jgi:hypothetical protein